MTTFNTRVLVDEVAITTDSGANNGRCALRYGRNRGFTLIELLVVMGILSVLAAILLPVLDLARENAKRAVCMSYLQGAGLSLRAYAQDNFEALPAYTGPTNWLWDIPNGTRDAIARYGMLRGTFYCPSGDFQNADVLWNWPYGYIVTGYFWLMARAPASSGPTLINGAQYQRKITAENPSSLELATDATISTNGNFSDTVGGWALPHRSSHMSSRYRTRAMGGNILFLDGHVAWRDIDQMQIRCQPGNDEWF